MDSDIFALVFLFSLFQSCVEQNWPCDIIISSISFNWAGHTMMYRSLLLVTRYHVIRIHRSSNLNTEMQQNVDLLQKTCFHVWCISMNINGTRGPKGIVRPKMNSLLLFTKALLITILFFFRTMEVNSAPDLLDQKRSSKYL